MKKIIYLLPLLFVLPVFAVDTNLIQKNSAVLQILDKPSGKTKFFNLNLNKPYKVDRLVINVKACFETPEYMPNENMAFIQINKNDGANESQTENIFSGWMYKSMPGQNPLADATYDVWLIECR